MNISPTANRVTPEIIVVSGSDYAWITPWAESIEGVPIFDGGIAWGKSITFHVDPDTDYEVNANLNKESFSFDVPIVSEPMDLSKEGISNNIVVQIYNYPNSELSTTEKSLVNPILSTSMESVSVLTIVSITVAISLIAVLFIVLFLSFFSKDKNNYSRVRQIPIIEDKLFLSDIKIQQESSSCKL